MQTEVGGSVDMHACTGMQMRCEPTQISIKKKNSYMGVMDACAGVRVEGWRVACMRHVGVQMCCVPTRISVKKKETKERKHLLGCVMDACVRACVRMCCV